MYRFIHNTGRLFGIPSVRVVCSFRSDVTAGRNTSKRAVVVF